MTLDPHCVFCKIVAGQIPANIVHREEGITAFRDLQPVAPVHVLIVPDTHVPSLAEADEDRAAVLGRMQLTAHRLAVREGIANTGYRLVINTGQDAGQTVHHLHLHLIGGRPMGPLA